MKRSVFRSIFFGALAGAAVYFMPFFLLWGLFFFLVVNAMVRMALYRGYRRWGYYSHGGYQQPVQNGYVSLGRDPRPEQPAGSAAETIIYIR